jgi:hypothetical protein
MFWSVPELMASPGDAWEMNYTPQRGKRVRRREAAGGAANAAAAMELRHTITQTVQCCTPAPMATRTPSLYRWNDARRCQAKNWEPLRRKIRATLTTNLKLKLETFQIKLYTIMPTSGKKNVVSYTDGHILGKHEMKWWIIVSASVDRIISFSRVFFLPFLTRWNENHRIWTHAIVQ